MRVTYVRNVRQNHVGANISSHNFDQAAAVNTKFQKIPAKLPLVLRQNFKLLGLVNRDTEETKLPELLITAVRMQDVGLRYLISL